MLDSSILAIRLNISTPQIHGNDVAAAIAAVQQSAKYGTASASGDKNAGKRWYRLGQLISKILTVDTEKLFSNSVQCPDALDFGLKSSRPTSERLAKRPRGQ